MESSTVNQPHPDDAPDEAEAFFGSPEPESQDPGAFDPEPALQPEPEPEPQQPQQPQSAEAQPPKPSGSISREYIVFHKLPLTEHVLKHLLHELETGERGGEPRFAFFEIHRAETRNAHDAVAEGYQKHQERLGDTVDMAAVSSKAFQTRHVAPRERKPQTNISIT